MDIKKEHNLTTISLISDFYLASPSIYAKDFFYYMLSVGHFYCKSSYYTARQPGEYDSYLLIYVLSGRLTVTAPGFTGHAGAGDTVLLNCYDKHSYGALEPTEFYYIHFDGNNSSSFVNELLRQYGNIFRTDYHSRHSAFIYDIVTKLSSQSPITESEISITIHTLLCQLGTLNTGTYMGKYPQPVNDLLQILNRDYSKSMTVADISHRLNVSEQHLSRLFKCHLGISPYKYLTKLRINTAALLLISTNMTIADITDSVGFSSESNFIKYFRSVYNTTPSKYRKT